MDLKVGGGAPGICWLPLCACVCMCVPVATTVVTIGQVMARATILYTDCMSAAMCVACSRTYELSHKQAQVQVVLHTLLMSGWLLYATHLCPVQMDDQQHADAAVSSSDEG